MAIREHKTSRRTLLGGLAVVAATPALAQLRAGGGAEWYALKAQYDWAKAKADAANVRHDEAWNLAQAEIGPEPDLTYTVPGLACTFNARRDLSCLSTPGTALFPQKTKDELRARWEAYEAASARAVRKYRLDVLGQASDDAGDVASDIWSRLLKMPAPDLAALLWKIEQLFGGDNFNQDTVDPWNNVIVLPMVADARRLLGGEM